MYNFIFWVKYSGNLSSGNDKMSARFDASMVTALALFIHVGFIYSIFKYWKHLGNLSSNFHIDKGIMTLLGILYFATAFFYYNEKRIDKIEDKFSKKESYHLIDGLKVLILILVPLIGIIIILSNIPK